MRITNKIIQNNSLSNINVNKTLQDQLSTMISTEKKISRPSEDPIIALRSLRLRTSVNQTSQYVDRNVEDAKSWLDVTEDAIDNLSEIITDIRKQYVKGTSDTLTPADRRTIAEQLEALAAEVYNTGNVDFAGRSVFTGFRTNTTLTFQKDEDVQYRITENSDTATLDSISYIHTGDTENDVYQENITRIRLSYNNLDDADINLSLTLKAGTTPADAQGTIARMSVSADPYAYMHDPANADKAVFVPETGEILIGSAIALEDIESYEVVYDKTKWNKGDLRPEHYFDCTDLTNNIVYDSHGGEIQYNVGVNQMLRINTTCDECFNHEIVRDLHDVINAIGEVEAIEKTIADIEAEIKAYDETQTAEIADAQTRLDAAKKAKTFIDEKLHSLFSTHITFAENYLTTNNVALTNCGTRSKRLELIENRLDTQLSTLKELKSENEDADVAETAIRLSSAEYAYDAALLATSKIIKESLLNYI